MTIRRHHESGDVTATPLAPDRLIVDDRGRTWKEPNNTTWVATDYSTDQEET